VSTGARGSPGKSTTATPTWVGRRRLQSSYGASAGPVVFQATYEPRYVYVPRAEVFSPVVGQRVLSPQASVSVQVRMHTYAAAPGGRAAGPPPEKLGYTAAHVPHSSAVDQAKLAPARGFSRPSSAVALGARPPTKTTAGMETAATAKGPATGVDRSYQRNRARSREGRRCDPAKDTGARHAEDSGVPPLAARHRPRQRSVEPGHRRLLDHEPLRHRLHRPIRGSSGQSEPAIAASGRSSSVSQGMASDLLGAGVDAGVEGPPADQRSAVAIESFRRPSHRGKSMRIS
jgi:hypothetical protein